MAFVTYTATRSIMAGHVASVSYVLDLSLQSADRKVEDLKVSPRSMSGAKETLYFGKIVTWQCLMFPIPVIEADFIREFLDSTADGQVFTFDPYGISGHSVNQLQVDREDTGYSERRATMTGDPQYSDHIEFSFTLSEHA